MSPEHVFLLSSCPAFGIYPPMAFRFGYIKVQAVGMLLIFATPVLMPRLNRLAESGIISFRFLETFSATQLGLTALVLAVLVGMISGMISMSIFEKKDL